MRFRALFSTLLTLPALASAGTLSCSPATLQDYLNASSVDCGRLQTSGFVYSDGGSGIPATDIYTAGGLQFAIGTIGVGGLNLIPISVAAGQTLTITISFQTRLLNPIVPPEGIFQSDLEMFVFDASGPGSLTIRSRECLGGLWSGSICPGTSLTQSVSRTSVSFINHDVQSFDKVSLIDTIDDITFTGPFTTSVNFYDQLAVHEAPEPSAMLSISGALAALLIAHKIRLGGNRTSV